MSADASERAPSSSEAAAISIACILDVGTFACNFRGDQTVHQLAGYHVIARLPLATRRDFPGSKFGRCQNCSGTNSRWFYCRSFQYLPFCSRCQPSRNRVDTCNLDSARRSETPCVADGPLPCIGSSPGGRLRVLHRIHSQGGGCESKPSVVVHRSPEVCFASSLLDIRGSPIVALCLAIGTPTQVVYCSCDCRSDFRTTLQKRLRGAA